MVRAFGVAFLFAVMLLALFSGTALKGTSSIPTASADALTITAKFDTHNPNLVIKGASPAKGHLGEVQVTSFEHGVANTTMIYQGTIMPGKVSSKDVTFTKMFDPASISLYQALTNGINIPTITFTFQRLTGAGVISDVYQVTYSNVRITSIDQSGTPSNEIVETVTFLPSKTTWANLTNSATYGWDFLQNKAS
jgi:type VI secretion system Hcp family effector